MTILASLETTKSPRNQSTDPVVRRRNKLVAKLNEQLASARALLNGEEFQLTRMVTQTNEDGDRVRVSVPKRFRPWYWHDVAGKWHMELKYGAKALPLSKSNDTAVVVGEKDNLLMTIDSLIAAVEKGELDKPIEAASVKVGKPGK